MRYTKEERERAWEEIQQYRNSPIYALVNSVLRSGMSRRIEFYVPSVYEGNMGIDRIGYLMARILDYPYGVDKGGIRIGGCGMDMRFHIVSNFNYRACALENPEMDFQEQVKKFGRIYDTYFFDANRIGEL